jgi:hypothetical protein
LSSTTKLANRSQGLRRSHRDGQRGQILLIFAGGLIAFLAVAALVFDVGQNLFDWRAQRNAADAAALAGSRYIADPACLASPSLGNCPGATQAALQVAELNGYGDGSTNCAPPASGKGEVCVHIPAIAAPQDGYSYAGLPGFLQVDIHTDRPSFFAAVLGVLKQNVDALAIAGNSDNVVPPYSMLSLKESCPPDGPGGQVGGNGDVTVGGTVVVNADSSCDPALLVNGNGSLIAPECDVVGGAQEAGNGDMAGGCDPVVPFDGTGDPLGNIDPGPMPGTPAAVEILSWNTNGTPKIPDGCPGSTSSISLVDSRIAAGDSATLPLFGSGDLAVVFAYRSGSNTPPAVPSGWTDVISDSGADGNSRSIGYLTLTGFETNTGTWTNATSIEVIIVRGQDNNAPIGVRASGGSAGSTMTTPALSGMRLDGHSWVLAFAGAASGANLATLTGANVLPLSSAITTPQLALHYAHDRNNWPAQDYGGSVTGPNRTDAVEVLANPNPSTLANPAGCTFQGKGGSSPTYNIFRIHPGVYPGGLAFKSGARVYMAPGTYWLAGGGFQVNAKDAQVVSVDGPSSTTPGRGVFIYDTEDTLYHDQCAVDPNYNGGCIQGISVRGSGGTEDIPCPTPIEPSVDAPFVPNPPNQPCQWIHLEPATSPVVPITNLLIFVDRAFSGIDIVLNGNAGKLELAGTIYDPWGAVQVTGGAGDSMAAQIISYTWKITGSGAFDITYDAAGVVQLSGVGLVQ